MRRDANRRRLIVDFLFEELFELEDISLRMGITMRRNTYRRRGGGRGIDDRKSGFGFRSGRGEDGSCPNWLSPISRDVMNQTFSLITLRVSRYMNGSISNSINLVSEIGRSSIFRINTGRAKSEIEILRNVVILYERPILS